MKKINLILTIISTLVLSGYVSAGEKRLIEEQSKLRETGITKPSEVKQWKDAGVLSIKGSEEWRAIGVHSGLISGIKKQGFETSNQLKNTCSQIVDEKSFTSNKPFKYINKCTAICLKVNQVLPSKKIFGYVAGKRAILAKAPNNLIDDFIAGTEACGVYKITGTQQINLSNGKGVMGNKLFRISSF